MRKRRTVRTVAKKAKEDRATPIDSDEQPDEDQPDEQQRMQESDDDNDDDQMLAFGQQELDNQGSDNVGNENDQTSPDYQQVPSTLPVSPPVQPNAAEATKEENDHF